MAKKKKTKASDKARCLCSDTAPKYSAKHQSENTVQEIKIPALCFYIFAAWSILILFIWFSAPQFENAKLSYFIFYAKDLIASISLKFLYVIPNYLLRSFLASLFLFSCYGAGRFLISKKTNISDFSLFEDISFSFATGLFLLSSWMFILASLHLLYPIAAWIFICVGTTAGIFTLIRKPLDFSLFRNKFQTTKWEKTAIFLMAVYAAMMILQSLTPEIFFDSLVYHLAVPNQWICDHGFSYMPSNIYSNLFMFHGMAYAAALMMNYSSELPKLVNTFLLLGSAISVLGIADRYYSGQTAIWTGVSLATFLLVTVAAIYAGTESFAIFYCTTALAAAMRALLTENEEGKNPPALAARQTFFWILSGLLAGCAMASKATCLLYAIAIITAALFYFRKCPKKAIRPILFFIAAACLPVVPWLIKNIIYCGNPFFPFATSVFGMPDGYTKDMISNFLADTHPQGGFISWIMHPLDLLRGKLESSALFTPLLFIMLPLLPYIWKRSSATQIISVFLVSGWLLWSFVSAMPRFLIPVFPAAAILMAEICENLPCRMKKIFQASTLAMCLLSLLMLFSMNSNHGKVYVFFNKMTEDEYLAHLNQMYPFPIWKAVDYINRLLPENSKIMLLGDSRSFYLRRSNATASVFNTEPLAEYASKAENAYEMYKMLRKDGFTHLLFNPGEGIRNRRYMQFAEEKTRKNFNDFYAGFTEVSFAENQSIDGKIVNTIFVMMLTDSPQGGMPANYFDIMINNEEKRKHS